MVKSLLHSNQPTIASPRMPINQESLIFDEDDLVKSFETHEEGVLFFALVEIPTFFNVVTGTLSIENENGDEIYNKSALPETTTSKINVCSDGNDVPMVGKSTVKFTLNGVAGGTGGTVKITLYLI